MWTLFVLIALIIGNSSCKSNVAVKEEPSTEVCQTGVQYCKIGDDGLSHDSIIVFQKEYWDDKPKSELPRLLYYRNLSMDEILSSERILRDDDILLSCFLDDRGSEGAGNGYIYLGSLRWTKISDYSRQYFGFIDSSGNNAIFLILFDKSRSNCETTLEDWNKNERIGLYTNPEGIYAAVYALHIYPQQDLVIPLKFW
jgi:hypothetical protein